MYPTHYAILGVQDTDDTTAINSAFKKLSLIWHPDRAINWVPDGLLERAKEVFKRINAAHEELADETSRNKYNMQLKYEKIMPKPMSAQEKKQADDFMKDYKTLKEAYGQYEKRMKDPAVHLEYLSAQLVEHKKDKLHAEQRIGVLEQQVQFLMQQLSAVQEQLKTKVSNSEAAPSNAGAIPPKSDTSHPKTFFTPKTEQVKPLSSQQKAFHFIFGSEFNEQRKRVSVYIPDGKGVKWTIEMPVNGESAKAISTYLLQIREFFRENLKADIEMFLQSSLSSGYLHYQTDDFLNYLFGECNKVNKPASVEITVRDPFYDTYIAPHIGKGLPVNQKLDEFLKELLISSKQPGFK